MIQQPPLSPEWCQRWKGHNHSWRHISEGGFNSADYDVDHCDEREAKRFSLDHHYSGSFPATRTSYGLYGNTGLAGVAVLSVPTNNATLANAFPGQPRSETAELGRFVLLDEVPAPAESWMIARVLEICARDAGIHGLIAFSDPVPRSRLEDNAIIFPGHIGHIYKAANATYTGRSKARTIYLLPDGSVFPQRAIQKIRHQHQGHTYAENVLIENGATPRDPSEKPSTWLESALRQARIRPAWHTGNHRYLFVTKAKRRYWKLGLPSLPYPQPQETN